MLLSEEEATQLLALSECPRQCEEIDPLNPGKPHSHECWQQAVVTGAYAQLQRAREAIEAVPAWELARAADGADPSNAYSVPEAVRARLLAALGPAKEER